MKFKLIFITILFSLNSNLFSQVKVTGKIVDVSDKDVELFEVLLLTKDSVALKSDLTNKNGDFQIEILQGDYILQIRKLGKRLYNKELALRNDLDLGLITIDQKKLLLKEVVITSRKKLIEKKVDRLIFNVENSITASGGDAIDALKITPNLRVSNDEISMIGKSGLGVLVDDKFIQLTGNDLINFLKSIQKDNIKKIEVITNPPAKYDAEGNSGLINIILKKAKKNSWNSSINTSYKQATYAIGSIGGSFNYQKDKLSFNSNLNYSNGSNLGLETSKILYPNQTWDTKNRGKYYTNLLSSRVGIDYQIKKNWNVGAQYINSSNKPNVIENNNTTIINPDNSYLSSIITKGDQDSKKLLNSINLHSTITLDTIGTKMNIDFDYLNYSNNINRDFNTNTLSSVSNSIHSGLYIANNTTNTEINNYATKIDIEQPAKWGNFNYGIKLSKSNTVNSTFFYDLSLGSSILDTLQSNEFKYHENTQSAYFSVNKRIAKKWETKIGFRMENTQTTGISLTLNQSNKNNYTRFFPTFYLLYKVNDNNSLNLSYNKRIRRPGFSELNPFRWYFSKYSYSEGNPYLQPNYTHNIDLSFSHKEILFTTLSFSAGVDRSSQVTLLNTTTYQQSIKRLNYFNDYTIRANQIYSFNKIKWFESQNSLDLYYVKSFSRIYPITFKTVEGYGCSISTSNSFILDKNSNFLAGVNFEYNFPSQSSSFQKNNSTNSLDVFIKAFYLKRKLQITLAAENLLKSNNFNNIGYTNNIQLNYSGFYDSRYIGFLLSYKFGNNNIKGKKRININEDEKNRIN